MKQLMLALACLLFLTDCRRGYRSCDVYFWSSTAPGATYHLYLNRRYAGEVPCLGPHTDGSRLRGEALYHRLPSGRYAVVLTDDQGHVAFRQHLTILQWGGSKSVSNEMDDTIGAARMVLKGNDFIEEFYRKDRPDY